MVEGASGMRRRCGSASVELRPPPPAAFDPIAVIRASLARAVAPDENLKRSLAVSPRKPVYGSPLNAAAFGAAMPLILGAAGMVKLGRFHWPLALLVVFLACFGAFASYSRTKHEVKYGRSPINSIVTRRRR